MILLYALACGSPATPWVDGPLADQLTETGGCGDARLFASDGGTTFVLVDIDGVIDGGDVQSFTLPDPAVAIALQVGHNLDNQACTDVMENDTTIDASWDATEGRLNLTLAPDNGGSRDATVQMIDVVFGDDDPARSIDYLEFVATIGVFPG
jgi:hypothetical protein